MSGCMEVTAPWKRCPGACVDFTEEHAFPGPLLPLLLPIGSETEGCSNGFWKRDFHQNNCIWRACMYCFTNNSKYAHNWSYINEMWVLQAWNNLKSLHNIFNDELKSERNLEKKSPWLIMVGLSPWRFFLFRANFQTAWNLRVIS